MTRRDCPSEFLCGYLDAALFTTDDNAPGGCDYVESGRSEEMFDSLPEWFLVQARSDCDAFQILASEPLEHAGDDWQNGTDFWYTRNGHGTGFWDRDYDDGVSAALSLAAKSFGECWLMVEDINGKEETGWFKALLAARQAEEDLRFRAADNDRRREYGLPTYDGQGSVQ